MRQVFAAEANDGSSDNGRARHRMLRTALARESAAVYDDAAMDAATIEAPAVDVFSSTFECDPSSPANRSSGGERRANLETSLLQVRASMEYVAARTRDNREPAIVLLENTDGLKTKQPALLLSIVRELLRHPYTWHIDVLCPTLHADVPNARRRVYFVGHAKRRRGPLYDVRSAGRIHHSHAQGDKAMTSAR